MTLHRRMHWWNYLRTSPIASMEGTIEFVPDGSQTVGFLGCEEFEDILFIVSAEICPHPHMANHGAGDRW